MGYKLAKVVLQCSVKLLKYFLYLVGLMFFGLGFDSKAKSRSIRLDFKLGVVSARTFSDFTVNDTHKIYMCKLLCKSDSFTVILPVTVFFYVNFSCQCDGR